MNTGLPPWEIWVYSSRLELTSSGAVWSAAKGSSATGFKQIVALLIGITDYDDVGDTGRKKRRGRGGGVEEEEEEDDHNDNNFLDGDDNYKITTTTAMEVVVDQRLMTVTNGNCYTVKTPRYHESPNRFW